MYLELTLTKIASVARNITLFSTLSLVLIVHVKELSVQVASMAMVRRQVTHNPDQFQDGTWPLPQLQHDAH